MANAIDAVHMVEASSELRVAQKNLLCGEDASMSDSKVGWHSTTKYGDFPIVWTQTVKAIPQSEPVPILSLRGSSNTNAEQVPTRCPS